MFKHLVVKLLYVAKRCRLDILLAIGFLCTRVSKATEQDWGKLRRAMQYIHKTKGMFLTIGADKLSVNGCWIDVAYTCHPDMKSNTGGFVLLGIDGVISRSNKQKLNAISLKESELIGCSNFTRNGAFFS